MHQRHHCKKHKQIRRQQRNADMVGNQAKQRRHEAGAHIGGGHLYADNGLRLIRAETVWRGMNDGGIDRRAAKANQHKARQRRGRAKGKQKAQHARQQDGLPQTDHLRIVEFQRQKARQRPPGGDAHEEQAGMARRLLRGQTPAKGQIAARPQNGGLFYGAIAEECRHDLLCARNADDLFQRERLRTLRAGGVCRPCLPQGKGQKQRGGQRELKEGDDAIACAPAAARQGVAHDVRSQRSTQPPHAVQPAHVAAGVV